MKGEGVVGVILPLSSFAFLDWHGRINRPMSDISPGEAKKGRE